MFGCLVGFDIEFSKGKGVSGTGNACKRDIWRSSKVSCANDQVGIIAFS